jgi:hypothetical protein
VKTKSVICRGRVRTIEDAVESWKADHGDAMEVRDLEDVVRECLGMRDFLREWLNLAWGFLFADKLPAVQQVGEMLRIGFERTINVLTEVQGCIQRAAAKGYEVDKAAEFQEALGQIKHFQSKLLERWPFLDPDQITASRADFGKGSCQSAEEILRELQSTDCGPG